ncbi:TPA: hypothetical protein OUK27_002076 [Enterococcus faecalis]|uniref:hypothetical protein n=1 Tax=Enterococcus faecalis TaxID=1351 RepID=UPI001C10C5F0|nr:hypothetical protein [Enterococcus faecalis]MBU5337674.1 hypothetical protein [Enterococcus faecalis]HCU2441997.1 hypothetical protein [Enterococcus faecalis]
MEKISKIISRVEIPEFIKNNLKKWDIIEENEKYVYLTPVFGLVEPSFGQPFLLVIDKTIKDGCLVFRDTPKWDELELNDIY